MSRDPADRVAIRAAVRFRFSAYQAAKLARHPVAGGRWAVARERDREDLRVALMEACAPVEIPPWLFKLDCDGEVVSVWAADRPPRWDRPKQG